MPVWNMLGTEENKKVHVSTEPLLGLSKCLYIDFGDLNVVSYRGLELGFRRS